MAEGKEKDIKTLKELVTSINEKFPAYKRARAPFERAWYQNMAFALGKHYTEWLNSLNRLVEYPSPTWRVKLTVNLIFSIWRILLAKILRIEPTLYVLPGTGEETSQQAADIGLKFLQFLWRTNKMDQNLNRFGSRGIIYGSSFFMPFFNKAKGEPFKEKDFTHEDGPDRIPWMNEKTGERYEDEGGRPLFVMLDETGKPKECQYRTGDADVDIVDPFQIYPTPQVTDDPETLTSFFRERVMTAEWVMETYGMEVKPDAVYEGNAVSQQIGYLLDTNADTAERKKDGVTVRDYFEKPSSKYPRGRIVTVAVSHDVPLQNEELPREYLKMPNPLTAILIKWDFITVPGRFWGMSLFEQVIPLQIQLNKMLSRLIEHVNLMAKGKWMIPTQSKVDVSITDEPAQIIRYFAGSWPMPQQATLAPLPSYFFESISAIQQHIYDVSGIHEVSHSRTPRGVRSGKAIMALQEMDDTSLGPTIKAFGSALQQLGMIWLHIGKERYTEPRLITVIGKNFKDYINDFKGSMLEDSAEVICQMGSELPQSKLARQELFVELYKLRAIDGERLLKLLEMTGDDLRGRERLDESKANIENDDMQNAVVRTVSMFDNHLTHIKVHNDLRKQPLYEQLDPRIRYIIDLHAQTHEDHLKKGAMTTDVNLAVQGKLAAMTQK